MTGLSAYTVAPVAPGAQTPSRPSVPSAAAAAPAPIPDVRDTRNRYLLKSVDYFAGFAHAITTYIAGVALADLHDLKLLYHPFKVAHGSGHVWDDFFAADPRGLVPPLAAPLLTVSNESGMMIDGRAIRLSEIGSRNPKEDSSKRVNATLAALPPDSLAWLRKGRNTFLPCTDSCAILAETQYAGLWLRERFWQAVRGRADGGGASHAAAPAAAPNVTIALHVRRGDVTWLDRYGKPSHRWVDATTVVEVLEGIRQVLGTALRAPAVRVDLYSERGWLANDTRAVRALAPEVIIHTDSSQQATVKAVIGMASADILLLGSSGFSSWAGLFGCGVKIGSADTGMATKVPSMMLPMRHVFATTSLTTRTQPFAESPHIEAFRSVWQRYAACKADAACAPTLCASRHLDDPRWRTSRLSQQAIRDTGGMQWRRPPPLEAVSRDVSAQAASGSFQARSSPALSEIYAQCVGGGFGPKAGAALACMRSRWERNVSSFLAARKSPKPKALG